MLKARAYKNYDGGKSGNGTYQNIINHIPPHDDFYSLYLGNCGVTSYIKPAKFNFLNDIDPDVVKQWQSLNLPNNYTISCRPALEHLKELSNCPPKNRFIYLDPPYRFIVRKGQQPVYRFEMNDNDHSDLLTQISAMSDHKIMISHYPDEMYDQALKGWNTFDFYSTIRNGLALERIYFNYDLTDELHDYSYIGADFREREANNRIKKNFLKKLKRLSPQLRNSIIQDLIANNCDTTR